MQGRPFLAHQLEWLAAQGVRSAVITVHYLAEQVIAFAREYDGRWLDLRIVREPTPLGTGGAVKNAFKEVGARSDWIVLNGDTYFGFSIDAARMRHVERRNFATLIVARVSDGSRYGSVEVEGERVVGFRPASGVQAPALVSCGLHIIEPSALTDAPEGAFSIEQDLFPDLARQGRLEAFEVEDDDAFFDIGTPEAYEAFCAGRRHAGGA